MGNRGRGNQESTEHINLEIDYLVLGEIYSSDNRTKYWKCCDPKRSQVTMTNITMEVENLENFTYDGNDTNFEPLYSLKDNVSIYFSAIRLFWRMIFKTSIDNQSDHGVCWQVGFVVLLSVFYGAISLTAVLGNSTVIFIVVTSRRMQVIRIVNGAKFSINIPGNTEKSEQFLDKFFTCLI